MKYKEESAIERAEELEASTRGAEVYAQDARRAFAEAK